jgi:hypothetical protein
VETDTGQALLYVIAQRLKRLERELHDTRVTLARYLDTVAEADTEEDTAHGDQSRNGAAQAV